MAIDSRDWTLFKIGKSYMQTNLRGNLEKQSILDSFTNIACWTTSLQPQRCPFGDDQLL
jgi:hypothetical protein